MPLIHFHLPATAMATTQLTFGIELEFICLRPKSLFGSAGAAIYDTLLENGIPATGHEDIEEDIIEVLPSYTRWRVDTDNLILSDQEEIYLPEGWEVEQLELSSRKFDFFVDDWRGEIAAVLKILRGLEALGCRFITNQSTGFHVHVGNGNRLVRLRTAKNVFQLVTAFERCFDELHSITRITFPEDPTLGHCYYPPSFWHTHADPSRGPTTNLFDRLASVEQVQTYEELGEFFKPDLGLMHETTGHNSAYNFDNLFPDPEFDRHAETLTGTIEFRQHTGTLDYIAIIAWVLLTCNVVEFCSRASAEEMVDLCLRAADPSFRLEDLFVALDCPEDVMDHYLNGAMIGVITEASSEDSDPMPSSEPEMVTSLIEQNDTECEARADKATVEAVIRHKYESGQYGLDSRVEAQIPTTVAAAELKKALVTVHISGVDECTEDGLSKARAQVFRQFARLYQRPNFGHELPLQSALALR